MRRGAPASVVLDVPVDALGELYPRMPSHLPDGHRWRGESRIRKHTDGDDNVSRRGRKLVEDRRPALGAEKECASFTLVGQTDVFAVPTLGSYPLRVERRLHAE